MAAWAELSERLEATLYRCEDIHCEATYHSGALPRWLLEPLCSVWGQANGRLPVLIVNQKGHACDDVLAVVRLADLEKLLGGHD